MISFVVAPIFLLLNVIQYLQCLGMPPVPLGATAPQLDEAVVNRIEPYTQALLARIQGGEEFERVAQDVALQSGTTPGQVVRYVHLLLAAQSEGQ